jgi:hypothetical protein
VLANRKHVTYPGGESPNLLVRDVPTEVHAALVAGAKGHGQLLQEYVMSLIREITDRLTIKEIMDWIEANVQDGTSAAIDSEDIVAIIRAGRDEREENIP